MTDVLVFVEDNGAANMMRGLRPFFADRQLDVVVVATGAAQEKLQQLGEPHVPFKGDLMAKEIIERWQPRVVAVGTAQDPRTFGLDLVEAARGVGILTVGLVDTYANYEFRWRGVTDDPLAQVPDWLVVPDEMTRHAYVALGMSAARVQAVGYVQIGYVHDMTERIQKRGRRAVRQAVLPPEAWNKTVLVFVAENFGGIDPLQHVRSEEYMLPGWGDSNERIHVVLEEVLQALKEIHPRPYVVLRLHPKNGSDDFKAYAGHIDYISRDERPLELVYSADMVVGSTSTLLLEAALVGRPTLAVVPRVIETGWLPSIAAGVTPVAVTAAQVRHWLRLLCRGNYVPPLWPPNWQPGSRARLADFLKERVNERVSV